MGSNFYQTNNEILKLDVLKALSDNAKKELFSNNDTLDFYFNHWISRKENLQRCKNEYGKGLFDLSYSVIETDFNISNKKARNLVKRFIDNGIIECIKKGKAKGDKSIYAYTSIYYSDEDIVKGRVKDIVKDIVNPSNSNDYMISKGIVKGRVKDIVRGNSKKEKEKENKKENNIYIAFTKIFNLWNEKEIVKHKEIKDNMVKAYKKALKNYTDNEIVEAIENYNNILRSDFYYNHKFTLENFLKQSNGIGNFTSEGEIYINYLEQNKKTPTQKGRVRDIPIQNEIDLFSNKEKIEVVNNFA